MHLDLEEQEQLAEIKAWWKQYGKWLIGLVAGLFVIYVVYAGWNWYQLRQSQAAGKLYEVLMMAAQKQDLPQALKVADDLESQYSSTSYAGMAGLVAAQLSNAAGDMANAEKHLRYTMDKAKSTAHSDIARARLISLLIDKADFATAEQLASARVSDSFKPLILERHGDVWLAQGKLSEARGYYRQAWDLLAKNQDAADESKRLLKIKLDAVGGL